MCDGSHGLFKPFIQTPSSSETLQALLEGITQSSQRLWSRVGTKEGTGEACENVNKPHVAAAGQEITCQHEHTEKLQGFCGHGSPAEVLECENMFSRPGIV